jgi:GNAT superfamily N-acetyltransferase
VSLSVVPAVGAVLERILDDTYPTWHDGLSRQNYGRYWAAQRKTSWGEAHLDRVALQDGPHVVASAKRYDLSLRLDGRIRRVMGIGAVFTAPPYRGRGAAKELLRRMMDTGEAEGFEYALLFSEIAPRIYEQLDFVPVPLTECRLAVDQKGGGPPAVLVRSGEERDLPAIAEISAARAADSRLALVRSEDFIKQGLARTRLLAGLGAPGLREVEFLVSEEGHQPVAYIVCVSHRGSWFVDDAGDCDQSGGKAGRHTPGDAGPPPWRAAPRDPRLAPALAAPAAGAPRRRNADQRSADDSTAEGPHPASASAVGGGSGVLAW